MERSQRKPETVNDFVLDPEDDEFKSFLGSPEHGDDETVLGDEDVQEVIEDPMQAMVAAKLPPPLGIPLPPMTIGEGDILTALEGEMDSNSRFKTDWSKRKPVELVCTACFEGKEMNELCVRCGQFCTEERHQLMRRMLGPTMAKHRVVSTDTSVRAELEAAQAEIAAREEEQKLLKMKVEHAEQDAAIMAKVVAKHREVIARQKPLPQIVLPEVPVYTLPTRRNGAYRSVGNGLMAKTIGFMAVALVGCGGYAYAFSEEPTQPVPQTAKSASAESVEIAAKDKGKEQNKKDEKPKDDGKGKGKEQNKKDEKPKPKPVPSAEEKWKQFMAVAKNKQLVADVETSLMYKLEEIPKENPPDNPLAIRCSAKARSSVGALRTAILTSGYNTETGKFKTVPEDLKRYESWQATTCKGMKK